MLAALCATQSADARPNDLLSNATAAWMLVLANDQNAAQVYLERSRSLAAQDPAESIASWVRLFPAYRSWLDADARETLRLVDSEPSIPVSDSLNQSLDIRAGWYIALGQLAKAQGLILTKSADDPSRELMLTTIALARGRDDLAATHVEKLVDGTYDLFDGPDTAYYWLRTQDQLAELYRRQGRLSDARRVEDRLLALLAVADDDHAILRRIRERRAGDS